jgi:hypothetical protein
MIDTQREPGIIGEVEMERAYQAAQWSLAHDETHTPNDWIALLTRHAGLAANDGAGKDDEERFRKQMVRCAALAVAAVGALDRRTQRTKVVAIEQGPGY